ncbi:MAG TPA: hypothetical protein VGG08_08705 [Solirubrobacteraceae bacterium]|jgi:hypothetical protein
MSDTPTAYLVALGAVVALTFVCLTLWVVLALAIGAPSKPAATLIEGISHSFTMCLGCLLGLLGGRISA